MVQPRQPQELATAIAREIDQSYDPATVATLGARGDWNDSAARLYELLRSVT